MMKSRPSLKNSARRALFYSFILIFFSCGCSSSTAPTYSKSSIEKSIPRILQEEYKIKVKARLIGSTLWVYFPCADMLEKAKKPEKFFEKFLIAENENAFEEGRLKLDYLIKAIPEKEKTQEYKFNKSALEKTGNVMEVLRRVIFSLDPKTREEIKFYYLVIADIKNGFEIKELIYYKDMAKVTYRFISPGEYHHRVSYISRVALNIIGDKEGRHLAYRDISMREFIASQIKHRINLKFQKPEVKQNADIDKEIAKIVAETLKIYSFREINTAELNNLVTKNRMVLKEAEIFSRPLD